MEQTMLQLEAKVSWKDSLRKHCRLNKLTIELASAFTPLRFRGAYARFKAIYQRRGQDKAERWLQNQLKAFEWFVVALSLISETPIKEFSQKQMEILTQVFYFKQTITLQYQVRKLGEDPTEKLTWTPEEQAFLTKIVLQEQQVLNKWNQFARKLFEISEQKFFRTGKQCRERWLNHLDPNKKHGEWTEEEDKEVASLFLTDGKKWSQISKKMGGARTEHMVKNRYKTLISKQKKLFPHIHNEFNLLKTFVHPPSEEPIKETVEMKEQKNQPFKEQIKDEFKSAELQKLIKDQFDEKKEEEGENEENKNVPQTSSGFEPVPQVYSPWYMSYHQITPTFSPFFVNMNVPTFSSFDASFSNQFYCPRQGERTDQL